MANKNVICVFDFESSGKYPQKSQPTSLSCVMVDPVRLEIMRNGTFDSLIKPVFDIDECTKLGLEPLQQEALDITGIKVEDLEKAPSLQEVWSRFVEHVGKFSTGVGKWAKPVACGYNIQNFDLPIVNRICGKAPYKFGPWDEERECQDLFHPRDAIDIMAITFQMFENNRNVWSISFDSIRKYFGLSSEGAHSSICDVEQNAMFLIRYMKWMRTSVPKMKLQDSMKDCNIQDFYDVPA